MRVGIYCFGRYRATMAAVWLLLAFASQPTYAAGELYWSEYFYNDVPEMQKSNLDGSNVQVVLPPVHSPNVQSIAVDPRDSKIYFGRDAADFTITSMNSDGSSQQLIYDLHSLDSFQPNTPNHTATPRAISIDTVHNKLYWTASENGSASTDPPVQTFIQRSNLDGSDVEIVKQGASNSFSPIGLVVDGTANKMYWSDFRTGDIESATLDGSNVQTLYDGPGNLWALTVDTVHQKLFWSVVYTEEQGIWTADLDGTNVQQILSRPRSSFLTNYTFGLAVDPTTSKLYYDEYSTYADGEFQPGLIARMNYDGSGVETIVAQANNVFGLTVAVPEPPSLVLSTMASAAMLVVALRRKYHGSVDRLERAISSQL